MTVFLPTVALLAMTPGLQRRRRVARAAARVMLAALCVRLEVLGAARVTGEPAVVVANHASYLDGIVLQAALPAHFAFVIKREVTGVPLVHFLLRSIGAQFVDRHSAAGRVRDARRLLREAHNGSALAFFPEGSIDPKPGLRPFRSGAFAAAARARVPVLPVAIIGSRQRLPPGGMRLRPGRIRVEVLTPLPVWADGEAVAARLRAEARRLILERLPEPDLDLETAAAGTRAAAPR